MVSLLIKPLKSGGLITNYHCTSRCRHCLYACSPLRSKDYIDGDSARRMFSSVREFGCHSVHVGGGEPFLGGEAIFEVIAAANEIGVGIDYIETNSSWYTTPSEVIPILAQLLDKGVSTLLVSISPFHNEFIPFAKVKGLIAACKKVGISVLSWSEEFIDDLNKLDDSVGHPISPLTQKQGVRYLERIISRYFIHPGGRALATFAPVFYKIPIETLLHSRRGCNELTDTSHFHLDLYGQFIPGLCAGLRIAVEDIGKPLDPATYPLITTLFERGVAGIHAIAAEHGFVAKPIYSSKCHLCTEIRSFLLLEGLYSQELGPHEFYSELNIPE